MNVQTVSTIATVIVAVVALGAFVRDGIGDVRDDLAEVRTDIADLREGMARVEVLLGVTHAASAEPVPGQEVRASQ